MKYFIYILVISIFTYQFFFKNMANADAKLSYEQYQAGKAIILDVRERDEVVQGMVKGATWLPLSKIKKDPVTQFKKLKEMASGKTIFAYCRSGNRSGVVADMAKSYELNMSNLGGFDSLVNQKIPTQTGP